MEANVLRQEELLPLSVEQVSRPLGKDTAPLKRAIESDTFPFETLSAIAELESWRKEVNRPIYHIHKWWAQRLGSVFRAIILGTYLPDGADVLHEFYAATRLSDQIIFDPFMGSGTTIGEALKCGARVIGWDINPVSFFLVQNALRQHSRTDILNAYQAIERDVAEKIQRFYRACGPNGEPATALYYFWVKQVDCPSCTKKVDLFPSYVFARHAYPKKFPQVKALCPCCGYINETVYDAKSLTCSKCDVTFMPQQGPACHTKATCPSCKTGFTIAKRVREQGSPPIHRLYAKLLLLQDGRKVYSQADDYDFQVFREAQSELLSLHHRFPVVPISPGSNTNQVLNYNYRYWHEMFNERQLVCLSILGERIKQIKDTGVRDLFMCLFSGTLEFNNMFASYKGEGTGAVRHMFSHHILKPERTPLEANLWGTPKSSGSFSTLFESRILRALDYCNQPFELRVVDKGGKNSGEKVFGLGESIGEEAVDDYKTFAKGNNLYLSCGDSSHTDIATESVDSVITDPPFFDNVHYSELADFFYVWQRHFLGENIRANATTRSVREVQHTDAEAFTKRLCGVWKECYRVLKKDGLLVFTYHHSRAEGWRSILQALMNASFEIVATHPIKGEMSGATPKHQAKEPINFDIVVVCRRRSLETRKKPTSSFLPLALKKAENQVERLRHSKCSLSRNDVKVIVVAQVLQQLSLYPLSNEALLLLDNCQEDLDTAIERIYKGKKRMVA